ncbi:hypothetical protein BZA77DRAFT_77516 [Pyronema omphalodes]|nr:hypothetical protein BZA77DRAFT_77516 [Pyronema omphalodes]
MCLPYFKVRMIVSVTLGRDSEELFHHSSLFPPARNPRARLLKGISQQNILSSLPRLPSEARSIVGCLRIPKSQYYPNTEIWSSLASCAIEISLYSCELSSRWQKRWFLWCLFMVFMMCIFACSSSWQMMWTLSTVRISYFFLTSQLLEADSGCFGAFGFILGYYGCFHGNLMYFKAVF